jgi:hypothetical protein
MLAAAATSRKPKNGNCWKKRTDEYFHLNISKIYEKTVIKYGSCTRRA